MILSDNSRNTFCITTKEQLDDAIKNVIQTIIEEGGDGDAVILVPMEHLELVHYRIDKQLCSWTKYWNTSSEGVITWSDNQEVLHLSVDTVKWCCYSELDKNKVAYPATFIYMFDFKGYQYK